MKGMTKIMIEGWINLPPNKWAKTTLEIINNAMNDPLSDWKLTIVRKEISNALYSISIIDPTNTSEGIALLGPNISGWLLDGLPEKQMLAVLYNIDRQLSVSVAMHMNTNFIYIIRKLSSWDSQHHI